MEYIVKSISVDMKRRDGYLTRLLFVLFVFLLLFNQAYTQSSKIDSLINKYELLSDNSERLKTALEIANLSNNSDTVLFLRYTKQALRISREIDDDYRTGQICITLGYFYSDRNLLKALDFASNSLKVFIKLDSLSYKSQAYTLLGTIYYYGGNYSKSFENYFESLKINELLKDETSLAVDYNNLAIIYSAQKNYRKALDYYFKALKINKKYKIVDSYSGNLMNISSTYGDIDSVEQEFLYAKMALDTVRKYNDQESFANVLLNIGYVYVKKKDFVNAEKYYAEAEEFIKKQGSKYFLYNLYSSRGEMYKCKNDFEKALYYYNLTFENAKREGVAQFVQDASFNLSEIYKLRNQYKESLFYSEIYHQVSDSMLSIENAKKITELELQYKFDKKAVFEKRKEKHQQKIMVFQRRLIVFASLALIIAIASLVLIVKNNRSKQKAYQLLAEKNIQVQNQNEAIIKQSDELRAQRDQLKHLNVSKDKIYSIIAHDLKNPFNAILGFTSLIISRWSDIDDDRKKLYIGKVNESATNAYELLENLLAWARSQTGRIKVDPECIEIKKHIDDTIAHIYGHAKSKGIEIKNLVEPSQFVQVDVNMVGTVLRNIISNAIKFTKEKGVVKIFSKEVEYNCLAIVIEDNGVGMPEESLSNLFNIETQTSTYGTNNEKGTGLGLLICKDFIEKNNGRIDVESEVGVGTKFIITFPKCQRGYCA